MSSDQEPFDKLETAIREFVQYVDNEGILNAWVLTYQTSILIDQPGIMPIAYGSDYVFGSATSSELATGLLRMAEKRIERDVLFPADTDE